MSTAPAGAERRIHPRYGFNFVMSFKHPDPAVNPGSADGRLEMAGTDLSVSGLGAVACPQAWGGARLVPGQKMMLKLSFEDEGEEFTAAAKVMWSRERQGEPELQQVGLKFVYVSSEALAGVLARLVRDRSPKN